MTGRKKMEEIVEAIFEALPVQSTEPVTTIANNADISWRTAQRYITMIMDIQNRPKVFKAVIGEQSGYRRETMAGRPPKK